MEKQRSNPRTSRRYHRVGHTVVTASGLALLTACSGLLDAEFPTRIPGDALDDPALAGVLVQSAIADFECAFAHYATATGLIGDELINSTGFSTIRAWDERRLDPQGFYIDSGDCEAAVTGAANAVGFDGVSVYTPLSMARFQAEDAIRRIEGWDDLVPDGDALLAVAAAYAGYSYTLFGEGFCEAPIDSVGAPLSPPEILAVAEQRFTSAIDLAQAVGDSETFNMALVGRARVRLNLGRTSQASADAGQVPVGFVKTATYSAASPRRENVPYVFNHRRLMMSVDPRYRALEVDGVPDARVPVVDAGRVGHDGITDVWWQMKYADPGAPIELATWEEAQLIIAEAEGGATAVAIINDLRARAGLPATFSSSDPAEILAEVIEERRREFYLEGHRLNDMLRFGLPFDTVSAQGVPNGDGTCVPLPQSEIDNNPNFTRAPASATTG